MLVAMSGLRSVGTSEGTFMIRTLLSSVLLFVACGAPVTTPDAADLPMADAGLVTEDSGTASSDAGDAPIDAGDAPIDAGDSPIDAGEADAGTVEPQPEPGVVPNAGFEAAVGQTATDWGTVSSTGTVGVREHLGPSGGARVLAMALSQFGTGNALSSAIAFHRVPVAGDVINVSAQLMHPPGARRCLMTTLSLAQSAIGPESSAGTWDLANSTQAASALPLGQWTPLTVTHVVRPFETGRDFKVRFNAFATGAGCEVLFDDVQASITDARAAFEPESGGLPNGDFERPAMAGNEDFQPTAVGWTTRGLGPVLTSRHPLTVLASSGFGAQAMELQVTFGETVGYAYSPAVAVTPGSHVRFQFAYSRRTDHPPPELLGMAVITGGDEPAVLTSAGLQGPVSLQWQTAGACVSVGSATSVHLRFTLERGSAPAVQRALFDGFSVEPDAICTD